MIDQNINLSNRFFYVNPTTDDESDDARIFPMSRLISMSLNSSSNFNLMFDDAGVGDHTLVIIVITADKGREAMKDVVDAINSHQKVVVLGDQFTGESIISDYVGGNVTISPGTSGTFALNGAFTVAGAATFNGDIRVSKFDLGAQASMAFQSDGTIGSSMAAGETNQWNFRCGNSLAAVALGDGQAASNIGPTLDVLGLNVSGDLVNNEGWEFRGCSSKALGKLNKDYFKIGTSPAFFFKVKFSIEDVSGINELRCGFAQKDEAFTATIDNYTDAAWMTVNGGDIETKTILDNAATVTQDLTAPSSGNWGDGETHTLKILVSATGVVTYELDDTTPTGVVAYTFADELLVTPMWVHIHASGVADAIIWQEFEFGLQ